MIGKNMMIGQTPNVQASSLENNEKSLDAKLSIAACPLATPIIGGPGTIASAMNFVGGQSLLKVMLVLLVLALLCIINYTFFLSGQRFLKFIGKDATKVINYMMGLILAVMGVQMIILGVYGAMHLNL